MQTILIPKGEIKGFSLFGQMFFSSFVYLRLFDYTKKRIIMR